jgi:hypothetical protein
MEPVLHQTDKIRRFQFKAGGKYDNQSTLNG